jgi:hypothetical protein
MKISIKIHDIGSINSIIKECGNLNQLFMDSFDPEETDKKILQLDLTFMIKVSKNDFGEPDYEINSDIPLELVITGKMFKFEVSALGLDFFGRFDDIIYSELLKTHEIDSNFDDTEILREKIKTVNPIESLYYRVKYKQEKDLKYHNHEDLLYIIVTTKEYVKDLEIVKDFLDNFYSTEYAELGTMYLSLPNEYYEKILNDKNINREIRKEIEDRTNTLPSISEIIKLKNLTEIENYYFKIWNNKHVEHVGSIVTTLFSNQLTTENMIKDVLTRYPFETVLSMVLSQKRCPEFIMLKYVELQAYHSIILKNLFTSSLVISKIFNDELKFHINANEINTLIGLIRKHPNTDQFVIKKIADRDQMLGLSNHLDTDENISIILLKVKEFLIGSKKVFIEETLEILKKISKIKELSNDNIQLLNEVNLLLDEHSLIFNNVKNERLKNSFTEEEFTSVILTRNDLYNEIIKKLKNIDQLEILLKLELEQLVSIESASDRLKAIKENPEFLNKENKSIQKILYSYKRDFVHYLNNLLKANQETDLLKILNILNENEGAILDNTIYIHPNDLDILEETAILSNNQEVLNNVLELKRKTANTITLASVVKK